MEHPSSSATSSSASLSTFLDTLMEMIPVSPLHLSCSPLHDSAVPNILVATDVLPVLHDSTDIPVANNVSSASPSGNDHLTTLEHLLSHVPVDDSVQNNSPFSHDHSPASSHPLSIDIIPHEPRPLQEIDSIHGTTSSSHSSGLQSNSSLSFDQAH